MDRNDKPFGTAFPYVAVPNNTNVNDPANTQNGAALPPPGSPGSGPSLPTPSVVAGIGALVLLGAGAVMSARRHRAEVPAAA